jgi:quinol monooxygenase YgiN
MTPAGAAAGRSIRSAISPRTRGKRQKRARSTAVRREELPELSSAHHAPRRKKERASRLKDVLLSFSCRHSQLFNKEKAMIQVIASICITPGRLSDYLAVLKDLIPEVRKEKGCIEYVPAVDYDAKLTVQVLDKNVVTILEKWEGLEELNAHLG